MGKHDIYRSISVNSNKGYSAFCGSRGPKGVFRYTTGNYSMPITKGLREYRVNGAYTIGDRHNYIDMKCDIQTSMITRVIIDIPSYESRLVVRDLAKGNSAYDSHFVFDNKNMVKLSGGSYVGLYPYVSYLSDDKINGIGFSIDGQAMGETYEIMENITMTIEYIVLN